MNESAPAAFPAAAGEEPQELFTLEAAGVPGRFQIVGITRPPETERNAPVM